MSRVTELLRKGHSRAEIAALLGTTTEDVVAHLLDSSLAEPSVSGGIEQIVVPWTSNSPDLLDGITVFTPNAGDCLLAACINITTTANGTGNNLCLYVTGYDPFNAGLLTIDPGATSDDS